MTKKEIDNTTLIVRYINDHIYDCNDPIILYFIKWYLMSSYTYTSDLKEKLFAAEEECAKADNYYRHCKEVVRKYKQKIEEYGN